MAVLLAKGFLQGCHPPNPTLIPVEQGSPNYGLWAKSGLLQDCIWPTVRVKSPYCYTKYSHAVKVDL